MLHDRFGGYQTTFEYIEPDNQKHYEFRKYINSKEIKSLGGMYSIYCEEDSKIIFRKNEYLRDRSYSKFSKGECTDAIDYEKLEENETKTQTNIKRKYYCLPSQIDRSKLTEEEFQLLRKLIKKGLVED